MEKSYNRLDWDFIRTILTRLGFHPKWIDWVMTCISTISYYILINGSVEGKIQPTRVIRRGDPFSPYIFILCVEFLSRKLAKNSENLKNIGILPIKMGPRSLFSCFLMIMTSMVKLLLMLTTTLIKSSINFVICMVN